MEDPLLAFPTGHSELVMYGTGVQSIDQMPHVLFWRVECYRAKEAAKAALKCSKFAKEQYEKELAGLYRRRAVEPRVKRARVITSRKGKSNKARADTMVYDEV